MGQKKFYQKLIKLDPLVKNKINFNDVQRSIRAIEIKKFAKKFENSSKIWKKSKNLKKG